MRSTKGKLLVALLNQSVYKLLAMLNMAPLSCKAYQSCFQSRWLQVPLPVYTNTAMMKEHCLLYMLEILDPKQ